MAAKATSVKSLGAGAHDGYGIIQLLPLLPEEKLSDVMLLQLPWQDKTEMTVGKIRDGLAKQFQRVSFLSGGP